MQGKQVDWARLVPASHAVANLLRLADGDLRDAEVLLRGARSRNALPLFRGAVAHFLGAVVVSEHGWPSGRSEWTLDRIPDQNPMRLVLAELDHAVKDVPE